MFAEFTHFKYVFMVTLTDTDAVHKNGILPDTSICVGASLI